MTGLFLIKDRTGNKEPKNKRVKKGNLVKLRMGFKSENWL